MPCFVFSVFSATLPRGLVIRLAHKTRFQIILSFLAWSKRTIILTVTARRKQFLHFWLHVSTTMAQMAHFSFPYYFTILNSEFGIRPKWLTFHFHTTSQFRIPNSEFRIPKFAIGTNGSLFISILLHNSEFQNLHCVFRNSEFGIRNCEVVWKWKVIWAIVINSHFSCGGVP